MAQRAESQTGCRHVVGAALKNWPNEVTVIWYSRRQSAWSCRQEDEFVAELKTGLMQMPVKNWDQRLDELDDGTEGRYLSRMRVIRLDASR